MKTFAKAALLYAICASSQTMASTQTFCSQLKDVGPVAALH